MFSSGTIPPSLPLLTTQTSSKTSFSSASPSSRFQGQFIIEVDASNMGVRAVLSQQATSDQKLSPCAFFSRYLSSAERNNNIRNYKLLAVKLALEEWWQWLEGTKWQFLVWTDHKNLEYIQTAKRLNSWQAQWALFFTRFNFNPSYRPGSCKIKPDALSCQF